MIKTNEFSISFRERARDRTVMIGCLFLIGTFFALPISVTASVITYAVAALFGVITFLLSKHRLLFIKHPLILSFLLFFILFLLGLSYTIADHHSAISDIIKHRWILLTPFLLLLVTQQKDRERMISFFLIGVCFILALSYLKWFGWLKFLELTPRNKADVFQAHIIQNFYFSFAAIIAAFRFLTTRKNKLLYAFIFLALSFNILFLSTGRTGYILYAVLIAYLFFYHFGLKGLLIALGLVFILFVTAYEFSPVFNHRVQTSINNLHNYSKGKTDTSIGLKLAMWNNSIKLIKQKPWLGYGTGGVEKALLTLPKEQQALSGIQPYVEIAYLNILLEFGILGFIIFCLFILCQWIYSGQLSYKNKFYLRAFLLSFLIGAIGNPFLISHGESYLYSVILATFFSALPITLYQIEAVDKVYQSPRTFIKTIKEKRGSLIVE